MAKPYDSEEVTSKLTNAGAYFPEDKPHMVWRLSLVECNGEFMNDMDDILDGIMDGRSHSTVSKASSAYGREGISYSNQQTDTLLHVKNHPQTLRQLTEERLQEARFFPRTPSFFEERVDGFTNKLNMTKAAEQADYYLGGSSIETMMPHIYETVMNRDQHPNQGQDNQGDDSKEDGGNMVVHIVSQLSRKRRLIIVEVDKDVDLKMMGGERPKIVIQRRKEDETEIQKEKTIVTDKENEEVHKIKKQKTGTSKDNEEMHSSEVHVQVKNQSKPTPGEQLQLLLGKQFELQLLMNRQFEAQAKQILSFLENQKSPQPGKENAELC